MPFSLVYASRKAFILAWNDFGENVLKRRVWYLSIVFEGDVHRAIAMLAAVFIVVFALTYALNRCFLQCFITWSLYRLILYTERKQTSKSMVIVAFEDVMSGILFFCANTHTCILFASLRTALHYCIMRFVFIFYDPTSGKLGPADGCTMCWKDTLFLIPLKRTSSLMYVVIRRLTERQRKL